MRLKSLIRKAAKSVFFKKKGSTVKDQEYKIGDYCVFLPGNHQLPTFQVSFKLYDRFLPVLARFLMSEGSILDIGANVGDTAIALMQNCDNEIICIEPSDEYFKYLELNVEKTNSSGQIKMIKEFVGTGELVGNLKSNGRGSAYLLLEESGEYVKTQTLDNLYKSTSPVSLIKVDTDGFDFDVLLSGQLLLEKFRPILFWENEIRDEFQLNGYRRLYSFLKNMGYEYLYVFDNFGNLILEETDFDTLEKINAYLLSMNQFECTRTFYYVDVLAATTTDYETLERAVSHYKKEFIFGKK